VLVPVPSAGVEAIIDDEDWPLVAPYRWYLNNHGYVVTNVPHPEGGMVPRADHPGRFQTRKTGLLLSRLIMSLEYGDRRTVDHDNHNKLDNRKANLVVVTHAENMQNILEGRGASSYRGVSWHARAGKWMAGGWVNNKGYYLGLFSSEEEAARVAAEWRATNMPHSQEGRTSATS
jgi:hypothetical protein